MLMRRWRGIIGLRREEDPQEGFEKGTTEEKRNSEK
jgi:hypothetical protein